VADKLQQANDTLQTVTVMKDNATAIVQVAKPFLGLAPTSWQMIAAVAVTVAVCCVGFVIYERWKQDSLGGPVMQALLVKLAIQYGVYALIAVGVVGGVAGYGLVQIQSRAGKTPSRASPAATARLSMRFAARFRRSMTAALMAAFGTLLAGCKRFDFVDPAHQDAEAVALRRQVKVLERANAAREARERFMPFIKFTSPDPEDPNDVKKSKYKNARHHDATRALEEVEKGEHPFPDSLRAAAARQERAGLAALPAWYIGRHPDAERRRRHLQRRRSPKTSAAKCAASCSRRVQAGFSERQACARRHSQDRLEDDRRRPVFFVGRGGSLTGRGGIC
jgi:hypothetical protein